jgi:lipoprotein-anchoring transpeptidase ErfK/SrfK
LAARKKTKQRSRAGRSFSLLAAFFGLTASGALVWMAANGRFDGWEKKSWADIGSEIRGWLQPSRAASAARNSQTTSNLPANHAQAPSTRATNRVVAMETNAPRLMAIQTNKVVLANPDLQKKKSEDDMIGPKESGSRPVRSLLEAQIALARLGISSGCIDGAFGSQTRRALEAFQRNEKLSISGELDAATKERLLVEEPLFIQYTVSESDLKRLLPVSGTWLGKSEQPRLDYENILELVAEKGRAHAGFIKKLNPAVNWASVSAGAEIKIPRIDDPAPREKAAFIRIQLGNKTLEAFDRSTNLLAHFPCSIARKVEKRPVGSLSVVKLAQNPNYVFDPAVFPESPEAKTITRKLILPPGPNNPVGTAWIGLDRPGYGIHGSPKPEEIGRTESHGCFRLANWNAEHLLQLVWSGLPVVVEP